MNIMIAFDGENEVILSKAMVNAMGLRDSIGLLQTTMVYLSVVKETPAAGRPTLKALVTEARNQLVTKIQSQIGDDVAMLVAKTDLQIQLAK